MAVRCGPALRRKPAMARRTEAPRALALAASTLLAACTLGPDYQRPTIDVPPKYLAAEPSAVVGAVDIAWWTQFGDPTLDALIAESLAGNLDLVAAAARVEQFHGIWGTTRSGLFPQVSADLT